MLLKFSSIFYFVLANHGRISHVLCVKQSEQLYGLNYLVCFATLPWVWWKLLVQRKIERPYWPSVHVCQKIWAICSWVFKVIMEKIMLVRYVCHCFGHTIMTFLAKCRFSKWASSSKYPVCEHENSISVQNEDLFYVNWGKIKAVICFFLSQTRL